MPENQLAAFAQSFGRLSEELSETNELLNQAYNQAIDSYETGLYLFNSSTVSQFRLYLSQISKALQSASSNVFLLKISSQDATSNKLEQNLTVLLEKHQQSHLTLNRNHLRQLDVKSSKKTNNIQQLTLISDSLSKESIVKDQDLLKLSHFPQLTSLSIKRSHVGPEGLRTLKKYQQLKDLDVSGCRFIGDCGLRELSGYQYVGIKANQMQGVSLEGLLFLIATSYNLNYLETNQISSFQSLSLLEGIRRLYLQNRLNFKWLRVMNGDRTFLFVNKLSYLTHVASNDPLTDQELQTIVGEYSSLQGIYISCCQALKGDTTLRFLIKKCKKLKRVGFRKYSQLRDSMFGQFLGALPNLQDIQLDQSIWISDRSVVQMANQLKNLKYLRIRNCPLITDSSLTHLLQKMSGLRCLEVPDCPLLTDHTLFAVANQAGSNLKILDVSRNSLISDEGIKQVTNKCPNLKQLILNGCEQLTDMSIAAIAHSLHKLHRLQVQWVHCSSSSCSLLLHLPLKTLNLNHCPLTDVSADLLPPLKHLYLASNHQLTLQGYSAIFSLKSFHTLDLRQNRQVNDECLEQLCRHSPQSLTHLELTWALITDKALLQLAQHQHQLIHLNLSGCQGLTSKGIGWLCSQLRHLQLLNLSVCPNIDDQAVIDISRSLTLLRALFLNEVKSITDNSVSQLSCLQHLEQLHLGGCSQVTSSSLIALLHHLDKLHQLNISQCNNIYAKSLLLLLERMHNLQTFLIGGLSINDRFLQMIGHYMQKLTLLGLQYCKDITANAVLALVRKCRHLQKVQLQGTSLSEKDKQNVTAELRNRQRPVFE